MPQNKRRIIVELVVAIRRVISHQVADVNDAGDFAARWRRLTGRANRVINCDGNSCFLLADGATNEGVAGRHWDKAGRKRFSITALILPTLLL